MQFWQCNSQGIFHQFTPDVVTITRPLLIVCGGGFHVDDPRIHLREPETPTMAALFDFLINYVDMTRQEFKEVLCEDLSHKLILNQYICRKLLGYVMLDEGQQDSSSTMFVQGPNEGVEICQLTYTHAGDNIDNLIRSYQHVEHVSLDAQRVVDELFAPLVRRFGDQIDVLCEHFRRITFFGISYGSGFVLEIENALDAVLTSYGHSLEIRARLMNSLSAIAVSN